MKTYKSLVVVVGVLFSAGLLQAQLGSADFGGAAALLKSDDAGLKIPDLKSASVADLSQTALKALDSLGPLIANASPTAGKLLDSARQAIATKDVKGALGALSSMADAVKGIPGVSGLLATSQQLVGAWALKQGFEPDQINGVLGALQTLDIAEIGVQATQLVTKGKLTDEQSTLLKSVINVVGAKIGPADEALSKVKGMFGR